MTKVEKKVIEGWRKASADCEAQIKLMLTLPWWRMIKLTQVHKAHAEASKRWQIYFDLMKEVKFKKVVT